MAHKPTPKEFELKARLKHGEKYEYLSDYVNAKTKIKISCKLGHVFYQTPKDHLTGHGCLECSGSKKSSTAEFKIKAKSVHGNIFDYSEVEYVTRRSKVKITCKSNHTFLQVPSNHLQGFGCPECSGLKKGSTNSFIEKARAVHGDIFDYSEVDYINSRSKVKVTCKSNHTFFQLAQAHLKGFGCAQCQYIAQSGENASGWNPNLTDDERENGRGSHAKKVRKWREAVFSRDSHTCKSCSDNKGGNLNAHHILPWSKFPEVRFDVDNGITLCKPCHHKYHRLYRLVECNHKTIAEFLSIHSCAG